MVEVIYCNPSKRELMTIRRMLEIPGVKPKTVKVDGAECQALEIEGIENEEYTWTWSGIASTDKQVLSTIVQATRWIDPILTEFKQKSEAHPPETIRMFIVSPVDGSCNKAGEITLHIGDKNNPGSRDEIEFAFIDELIHYLQFWYGGEPYFDVTEDKERMIELAYRCLPNAWIPKRYEELRERFKP